MLDRVGLVKISLSNNFMSQASVINTTLLTISALLYIDYGSMDLSLAQGFFYYMA